MTETLKPGIVTIDAGPCGRPARPIETVNAGPAPVDWQPDGEEIIDAGPCPYNPRLEIVFNPRQLTANQSSDSWGHNEDSMQKRQESEALRRQS